MMEATHLHQVPNPATPTPGTSASTTFTPVGFALLKRDNKIFTPLVEENTGFVTFVLHLLFRKAFGLILGYVTMKACVSASKYLRSTRDTVAASI